MDNKNNKKSKIKKSNRVINNTKKVALCFFGLCRSTNYTIDSINKYIFDPLKQMNFKYDIYLHTYITHKPYNNPRAREYNLMLNNDLYKLLNPNVYKIDDQDEIKKTIDFNKYRTKGDPWSNGYNTLNNYILQLYSLNQVTKLWSKYGKKYDYVIYLRPDVLFLQPLVKNYFDLVDNNNIILPNFHEYPINDRFAIGTPNIMKTYGRRCKTAYRYSLLYKLHAEEYLNYILVKNSINIIKINFKFLRIRANGKNQDENLLNK